MPTTTETIRDVDKYEIVVTNLQSHFFDFVVYEVIGRDEAGNRFYNGEGYDCSPDLVGDRDKAQKFLDGSIKWDGCVNFSVEDEPIHFCSRSDAIEFGKILPEIYDMGKELIPGYEGD
jgi:hypothetical protein